MGFLRSWFEKKKKGEDPDEASCSEAWTPLPIPAIPPKCIPLEKYALEKSIGELHQARPPRKAQLWQGKEEGKEDCFMGIIEASQENQKWLEERLGEIKNPKWSEVKAQGAFRKVGAHLSLITFETFVADRYRLKAKLVSDAVQETYEAWDCQKNSPVYFTLYLPQKMVPLPDSFVPREEKSGQKSQDNPHVLEVLDEGLCKPFGIFSMYPLYSFPNNIIISLSSLFDKR
jgi:hypothetical protein